MAVAGLHLNPLPLAPLVERLSSRKKKKSFLRNPRTSLLIEGPFMFMHVQEIAFHLEMTLLMHICSVCYWGWFKLEIA